MACVGRGSRFCGSIFGCIFCKKTLLVLSPKPRNPARGRADLSGNRPEFAVHLLIVVGWINGKKRRCSPNGVLPPANCT